MEIIYIILTILLILVGFIFIKKYLHLMNLESFDNFSPYRGNQSYPWVYQKHIDDKAFKKHWLIGKNLLMQMMKVIGMLNLMVIHH